MLAFAQGAVGGITLDQVEISLRVITKARNQFNFVRQFYQIIIGPHRESLAFDLRIFVGREDDDRRVLGGRVSAKLTNQRQTVYARHYQVLQDYGRFDLISQSESFAGVGTVMEIDIGMMGEGATHRFTHHRLVIDQQYHYMVIRWMSGLLGWR